ncbi:CD276 antigen-like [Ambystoma mexicanum]|uniref:CD276 antigen-like n=1 Tax=Ambystoma mexicanum TaxID=8296 RepID=UPI0037E882A9
MEVGGALLFLLFSSACDALQLFVNSPQAATLGADTLLQCHFVVENPPVDMSYLSITWSFKGKTLLKVGDMVQAFEPRARIDEPDILNGNASLILSNLTINDGGTYSCSVLYSPFSKEETVTLKIQAKPKVIIPEQVPFRGKETLLKCYVFGFYPMEIAVSWLKNGQILPGSSTSKPLRDEDGTFNVTSTVTVLSGDSDASLNLSCHVQHPSLPGPLQKDVELLLTEEEKGVSVAALVVSMVVILVFTAVGLLLFRKYAREQEKLKMSEIRGPRVWTLGEPVQLLCVGYHCPEGTEIKWTKLHKGHETMINPNPMTDCQDTEPLLGEEGHKAANFKVKERRGYVTINSAVIVTPTMGEDEGVVFKCRFFTKDSKKINEEKEFKDFKIQGKPQATDIKCVPLDGNSVQCSLELLRFYPKGLQLKWSSGTGSLKDVPFEEHEIGAASGFSIRSTCVINEDAFTDPNFKIRVTWEHSSLDDLEYKEISVTDPGKRSNGI